MRPMANRLFLQLTLPLMVSIVIAAFTATLSTNKRLDKIIRQLDDTNRRFDDVNRRLDRLDSAFQDVRNVLMSIDHRLTVLEERSSPLVRG